MKLPGSAGASATPNDLQELFWLRCQDSCDDDRD
jgi:hypothetical protein